MYNVLRSHEYYPDTGQKYHRMENKNIFLNFYFEKPFYLINYINKHYYNLEDDA